MEPKHWILKRLYQDEAYEIARALGRDIMRRDFPPVQYRKGRGVVLYLENFKSPVALIPEDFEALLGIFEDSEYSDRLASERQKGLPDLDYYDRLIQSAVNEVFPPFPD